IDQNLKVLTIFHILASGSSSDPPIEFIFEVNEDNNFVLKDGEKVLRPDPDFVVPPLSHSISSFSSQESVTSFKNQHKESNNIRRIAIARLSSIKNPSPSQKAKLRKLQYKEKLYGEKRDSIAQKKRLKPARSTKIADSDTETVELNLDIYSPETRELIDTLKEGPTLEILPPGHLQFHIPGAPSGEILPDTPRTSKTLDMAFNIGNLKKIKNDQTYGTSTELDINDMDLILRTLKKEQDAKKFFDTEGLNARNKAEVLELKEVFMKSSETDVQNLVKTRAAVLRAGTKLDWDLIVNNEEAKLLAEATGVDEEDARITIQENQTRFSQQKQLMELFSGMKISKPGKPNPKKKDDWKGGANQ
ncbi:hypothetical protein HK096_007919, partial [Nowakowskiella sp. JEL0078]